MCDVLDFEIRRTCGWKPIHYACLSGNVEIVELLVNKNIDLEVKTEKGHRPIHIACIYGHFEIVKLLIRKGVDLNAVSNSKKASIYYACKKGRLQIIKLLVSRGVYLDNGIYFEKTPIYHACRRECLKMIKLLVEGTNPTFKNTRSIVKLDYYNDKGDYMLEFISKKYTNSEIYDYVKEKIELNKKTIFNDFKQIKFQPDIFIIQKI